MAVRYLLLMLFFSGMFFAKTHTALSHNEHLFKEDRVYRMEDFNLTWDIDDFVIYRYDIFGMDDRVAFKDLKPVFHGGKIAYTEKIQHDIEILANMMLKRKEKYFLNKPHGIRDIFHLFIFRKDGKTYALESFDELKQILGRLDTPAELLLWLRLKYLSKPDSYLYSHGIWRVRFSYRTNCGYGIYFEYYDRNGEFINRKEIKSYRKKNCREIVAD